MAYRFIEQNKKEFGLRWLLNRMVIFPNAYYNYTLQTKAEYQAKKEARRPDFAFGLYRRKYYAEVFANCLIYKVICIFFGIVFILEVQRIKEVLQV